MLIALLLQILQIFDLYAVSVLKERCIKILLKIHSEPKATKAVEDGIRPIT